MVEKHVRRVVWRWGDKSSPWNIYGFLVVSMGDRPATVVLHIAIKITVIKFGHVDLMAARCINEDMFVDNVQTGGSELEVARYKGEENTDWGECDGTIPNILRKGGFKLKAIKVSGEENDEKLEKLGGAALGNKFSCKKDTPTIKFKANVTKRRRGKPTGGDLNVESLHQVALTRRVCLSVTNSIFNPVGFVAPVTFKLKVYTKRLFMPELKLGWDTALPKELQREWWKLICKLVEVGEVEFLKVVQALGAVWSTGYGWVFSRE